MWRSMQHRMTRLIILSVLLALGIASGFAVSTMERTARQRDQMHEAKEATIERLLASIAVISGAQQAFADYARRDMASFTQVALQVDRLTTEAAGLRAAAQSGASTQRLEEFWTALSALMSAESRARELFAGGNENAAADAILLSPRDHVATMNSTLQAFRQAERTEHRRGVAAASWLMRAVVGATALLWAAGLVAFAVRPLRESPPAAAVRLEAARPVDLPVAPPVEAAVPTVDLTDAATLARELSGLSDQAALEAFLGRAASILDARGIIIWMRVNDELVAAAGHGYAPSMLGRIPSIARSDDNATAAAWRTGETGTVPEDASGYGAIVAPMLNPAGCVGVFAAEVRGGRERDLATCSLATVLASQLAGVLAAWPAPSTAGLDSQALDRQAAAS